jgi:molecular chaperone DnaK (HSP70)
MRSATGQPYFGIDFGTTDSTIACVIDDPRLVDAKIIQVQAIEVPMEESENGKSRRMPTMLAALPGNGDRSTRRWLIGWEFLAQMKTRKQKPVAAAIRHGENLFRSVKSDLGTNRIYPRAVSPEYRTPAGVAARIIRYLL